MDSNGKLALILDAAKGIFAQYGYRKTTVQDVALAVGMTKSNLYFYVSNKQDLYDQVLRKALFIWHNKVLTALQGTQDTKERFIVMAERAYCYLNEDTDLCAIIIKDPAIFSVIEGRDGFNDLNKQSVDLLGSILQDGIDQGVFLDINVERTAEFLFSTYQMLLIKTYVQKEVGAAEQFEQSLDIIVRGISVEK